MKIVSLSGGEGAGKDHITNMVVDALNQQGVKAVRFSFAKGLYEEVSSAFNVSIEELQDRATKETPNPKLMLSNSSDQNFNKIALDLLPKLRGIQSIDMQTPLSPREVLQLWGTEYRRNSEFGRPTYWEDQVFEKFRTSADVQVWVGSDTRMTTEIERLRNQCATLVRLNADWQDNNDENYINQGHPSKWEWRLARFDRTIINQKNAPNSAFNEVMSLVQGQQAKPNQEKSRPSRSRSMAMGF